MDSDIRRAYSILFKKILLCNDLVSYRLVKVFQISFGVFFSSMLDSTSSTSAKCKSAIASPSIFFYFLSLVIVDDLAPLLLNNCPLKVP